ncbi:hypothetical protein GCM10010394_07580 [Streptomyces crystallinus]|uniref:Uncharacterized protein n=1 Tax=Streptomyces crystallinus TaxID=68191 RepID=A0ABP3Q4D9_9ACTN
MIRRHPRAGPSDNEKGTVDPFSSFSLHPTEPISLADWRVTCQNGSELPSQKLASEALASL